ncbi:gliding motility-associated C-terminal domain-containing protein [Psychroserpens algicola]|uniref:Gliding motility-associated C-terminal domain-containing protein n=1 Tax=Psychroserpens algicola TaxID=1719034 RepID=A0ABT0H6W3_9FLAO|nr:gliding motility-associated C-terminal domain-containing protein [Psychroserpens algicola]MCK8480113.1 gliding motility-associated C-terminal domain-containing protein [Psychroserpens algicola]
MIRTLNIFLSFICVSIMILSCNKDDDKTQEIQDIYEGCCSIEPVFGANIDNLDQSAGDIEVYTIVTQNGDGFNDMFAIKNINLYPNHTVTIYNSDNEQIYESTNYAEDLNRFPGYPQDENNGAVSIPNGTYKYKIVIENEETFRKSGSFCVYTWADPEPSFVGCNLGSEFDPIIAFPPN